MNIADRIQTLRKARGMSQEELADKIGVSRQAVSKWESEQSMPDIQKIIIMSDYFGVTTDYILKGIEQSKQSDKKADANIFVITATVLNFIGFIVAAAIWYEEQVATAIAIGFILMAMGGMIFGIGTVVAAEQTKKNAIYRFWFVNIWILAFIPISIIYNGLFIGIIAPYPILVLPLIPFFACWAIYIAICVGTDLIIIRKKAASK